MHSPDKPGRNLTYPDDDAQDIHGELYQAGFSSRNVMALIDRGATKAIIEAGFKWLDERESAGTLVVVSFSGHGGQIPDVTPFDEAGGEDEFIVPHDTTLTDNTIIADNELDEWLSRLEE